MILEAIGISLIPLLVSSLNNSGENINLLEKIYLTRYFNFESLSFVSVILILFFIFFLKNFFILFTKYKEELLYSDISNFFTRKLFEGYLKFPYEYYLENNRSEMVRTIYSINNIQQYLRSFNYLINDILLIFFILIVFAFYNIISVVVFLVLFSIFIIFYFSFVKNKIIFFSKSSITYEGLKFKLINQGLLAFKEAKILNIQSVLVKDLELGNNYLEKNNLNNRLFSIFPRYIIEIVFVGILLCLAYLIKEYSTIDTLSFLALLTIAVIRTSTAIIGVIRNFNSLNYSKPFFKLILSELEKSNNILTVNTNNLVINKFENKIIFKNIFFQYKNSKFYNLEDITFQINMGDFVGIKGPSGSGKTTVINILLGLIGHSEGQLVIDEVIVPKNKTVFWGNIIGYVPQEPYLIDDTIINNIAFGIPKELINMNLVYNSIKLSSSDKFINNFPNKLNEMVGENGIRLSGGQKQRIALARALYIQPKILVLDEATNALDNFLEDEVIKTIGLLKKKYTIIMISHRSSCFKDCDKIISLDQGKVISNFDCKK
jgi:ABC-type bacteriocin/lantibiotic exporter with double-glycine peptidase domain